MSEVTISLREYWALMDLLATVRLFVEAREREQSSVIGHCYGQMKAAMDVATTAVIQTETQEAR